MAEGVRDFVETLRAIVSDTYLTFPLIMIGFIFFLGILTSNSGLLFLFLGHLFVVPSLEFVANEPGPAWYSGSSFSVSKFVSWLFSVFLVLGINASALGGGNNYLLLLLSLIPFIGQFVMNKSDNQVSPLYFFNPVAWFMTPNTGVEKRAAATCSMVPNLGDDERIYRTPSYWMAHLMFFFGFFMTNAWTIYNQPAPKLIGPKVTDKQRVSLAARVANRQSMAIGALFMLFIVAIVFFVFRYRNTPCESNFLYSLIPLIIIQITGGAWFYIIYNSCGVKPADILGIVQGYLSPNMVDAPIVCLGSEDIAKPVAPPSANRTASCGA